MNTIPTFFVNYKFKILSGDEVEITHREMQCLSFDNAVAVAKQLKGCADVAGEILVINGLTGEIVFELEDDDESVENSSIKASAVENPSDEFIDAFGMRWTSAWSLDCDGISCSRCPYYGHGLCDASDELCATERDALVRSAMHRRENR